MQVSALAASLGASPHFHMLAFAPSRDPVFRFDPAPRSSPGRRGAVVRRPPRARRADRRADRLHRRPYSPRRGRWDERCGFADSEEGRRVRCAEELEGLSPGGHQVRFLDVLDGQYLDGPRPDADARAIGSALADFEGALVAAPVGAGHRPRWFDGSLRRVAPRGEHRSPSPRPRLRPRRGARRGRRAGAALRGVSLSAKRPGRPGRFQAGRGSRRRAEALDRGGRPEREGPPDRRLREPAPHTMAAPRSGSTFRSSYGRSSVTGSSLRRNDAVSALPALHGAQGLMVGWFGHTPKARHATLRKANIARPSRSMTAPCTARPLGQPRAVGSTRDGSIWRACPPSQSPSDCRYR